MTKKSKGNLNGKETSVQNTPTGIMDNPMVMGIVLICGIRMVNGLRILSVVETFVIYVNYNSFAYCFALNTHDIIVIRIVYLKR